MVLGNRVIRIYIFIHLIWIAYANENDQNDSDDDERIVGGSDARIVPYQVSLRNVNKRHFCGGSIINKNWVLTAAHCLTSGKLTYIAVGSRYRNSDDNLYDNLSYAIHPDYEGNENDIALINSETDIVFNRRVQPISLPNSNIADNTNFLVTGWGKTSHPGSAPLNLQILQVKSISSSECASMWPNKIIESTHLCTLSVRGKGVCMGDSGGPLVAQGRIHGIVSWGNPCARARPDVYTRVYPFIRWIMDNISA